MQLKLIDVKTQTYEIEKGFRVNMVEEEGEVRVYVYHKDFDVKRLAMYLSAKSLQIVKDFDAKEDVLKLVERELSFGKHLIDYYEKHMIDGMEDYLTEYLDDYEDHPMDYSVGVGDVFLKGFDKLFPDETEDRVV